MFLLSDIVYKMYNSNSTTQVCSVAELLQAPTVLIPDKRGLESRLSEDFSVL